MIGIKCVVFDFGGVISQPQTRDYLEKLIQISGLGEAEFVREYRNKRHSYDRGTVSAEEYWRSVVGTHHAALGDGILEKLIEYDVASWTSINDSTKAYIQLLARKGVKIAILSNINFETVRFLETHEPWIATIENKIFSCELKCIKPEREIYEACMNKVRCMPHECVFIDDSRQNVEAARELGMNAVLFETAEKMKMDIESNYVF